MVRGRSFRSWTGEGPHQRPDPLHSFCFLSAGASVSRETPLLRVRSDYPGRRGVTCLRFPEVQPTGAGYSGTLWRPGDRHKGLFPRRLSRLGFPGTDDLDNNRVQSLLLTPKTPSLSLHGDVFSLEHTSLHPRRLINERGDRRIDHEDRNAEPHRLEDSTPILWPTGAGRL